MTGSKLEREINRLTALGQRYAEQGRTIDVCLIVRRIVQLQNRRPRRVVYATRRRAAQE